MAGGINSRKPQAAAASASGELLGTIALHCKTPPLTRRGELLGTIALHWKTPSLGW